MPGGRPKGDQFRPQTMAVRVQADIGKMISWVLRVEGSASADLLDSILRPAITARYNKHMATITAIKQAEDTARADAGLPPTEPLPVVINVTDTMTFEELRAATAKIDQANEANRLERLRTEAEGIEVKGKKKGKRE